MALKRRQFTYDKANWKKRVKRISKRADEMLAEAKAGSRLSLGEIFEIAHELHNIGVVSKELSDRAGMLNMHPKVQREIAYLARILALYSQTIYKYADDMNYPVRTYPLFVTELEFVVPREELADPMDDLDRVLGGDDGQA